MSILKAEDEIDIEKFKNVVIYKLINLKFKIKLPKYTSYVLLVIVILYGILRNIDTFGFLKPTTL